jgi:hypothetical protein
MSLGKLMIAGLFLLPAIAPADQPAHAPTREVQLIPDRQALTEHLRSLGFKARGGVDRDATARDEASGRSFPHFSSSFTVKGVTYPFTMVGHPPASGRSSLLRSVIVPLRMNFVGFGSNGNISHTFEPGPAVTNMTHSPLYKSAAYPGGFFGQFGDSMQRAAFWNQMDEHHRWHLVMDEPEVAATVDIEVTPETGQLSQDTAGNFMGNVFIDFIDSQIRTILQFLQVDADTVPIFVTDNVTAEALGYHTAFALDADGDRLQTFIYTSWLDPAIVPPIFADVSTFNHELLEWMNDPFINNQAPDWFYPPPTDARTVCSQNPFLEVGDPQGNGPTFDDFPAAVITIDGVAYHLQQLVLWQWFTDQVPSSAFGGWYTFPIPSSLTVPAVYCP